MVREKDNSTYQAILVDVILPVLILPDNRLTDNVVVVGTLQSHVLSCVLRNQCVIWQPSHFESLLIVLKIISTTIHTI